MNTKARALMYPLALGLLALLPAAASAAEPPGIPDGWSDGYVYANGVRLHYYHAKPAPGKPVIVMCHGVTDNGLCWTTLTWKLQDAYDIYMLDTRGHGLSDPFTPADNRDTLVKDVVEAVRALNVEKPILLGHSMGAATVMRVGAEYPDLAKAVIRVLAAWSWAERPVAVVWVPSLGRPRLVQSLAEGVAAAGRLELLGPLELDPSAPTLRGATNSAYRVRDLWERFSVSSEMTARLVALKGPVLLIDDLVDSRWTMTIAGRLLRRAGADFACAARCRTNASRSAGSARSSSSSPSAPATIAAPVRSSSRAASRTTRSSPFR